MTSVQTTYFVQTVAILEKYSLASIIEELPIADINALILKHRDELMLIDTYDKAMIKGSEVLLKLSGLNLNIQTFISKQADLKELYRIALLWRDSVIVSNK